MKPIGVVLAVGTFLAASAAIAAGDVDNGKRQAQERCGSCHSVTPNQRREVSDSPPFEAIARKYSPDMIIHVILTPHPRMNLRLTRGDAEDIAAYIVSLAQ